jgi:hypothetical protein
MKTRRGITIFLGSLSVWGLAAWLLRHHLPDAEAVIFLIASGTVTTGLILETVWRVDEPDPTPAQIVLVGAMMGLTALALMWTPLPADQDFPRLMSVLPWRFNGDKAFGALLAAAFTVWTVLAGRVFEGFERRYWLGIGANATGIAVLDTFFFGHINPVWPIGLLLTVMGFFGPDLQWLVWRRPRDVFGSARFEDDKRAARKAGLG